MSALPWVNATLNAFTAGLLVAGFAAIRLGKVALHRALMTTSLGCSGVFLVSYIVYHWFTLGPARYEGPGRGAYLVLLITHVLLAAVILPAALTTWWRGWNGLVSDHRRVAPATLAVWLYVALSGVAITVLAHR